VATTLAITCAGLSTVTVNVVLALLPCASTAVHVTTVVPIAKTDPGAGSQSGVTSPSTSSVAVTV
jgi:hypothetical protein